MFISAVLNVKKHKKHYLFDIALLVCTFFETYKKYYSIILVAVLLCTFAETNKI